MGIPVEVPGLDTLIPQVAKGRLVVVESGADQAKSFFVRRLGLTAIRNNWPVTFITSRDRSELQGLLTAEGGPEVGLNGGQQIVERDSIDNLDQYARDGGLLVVDSFSFLTLNLAAGKLSAMLRSLRNLCHEKQTTAILATDRGMFEPQAEAVATHLADGVIQFHAKEGPEGLIRYLRIPKWMDGKFVDRNVYYEFNGKRLAIDLRRRVL